MTSQILQPTSAEIEALHKEAVKRAGGVEAAADNHLFQLLYSGTDGYYPRRGKASVWMLRLEDGTEIPWAPGKKGELVRYRRTITRRMWIEALFPVRDIDGKIVNLRLNPAQRKLEATILRMERAGVPVRIQILKARQLGFSTYVQAFMFEMILRGSHVRGLIVAHNQDTSKLLLGIADIARTQMLKTVDEHGTKIPWDFTMKSKASYSLEWDLPIYGQVLITSAKTEGAGIGGTRTIVHFSEGSRYENASTVHQGVMPSLPNRPGTYAFDESTAFGDTGKFHDDFWEAWKHRHVPFLERTNPWHPVFYAWYEHPLYNWTNAYGFGRPLPQAMEDQILATLTADEKKVLDRQILVRWTPESKWVQEERWGTPKLVWENGKLVGTERATEGMREPKVAGKRRGGKMVWKRVGVGMQPVTVNQLAWRRARIEDKDIGGDLKKFDQDYPWCPEVAFMASGNPVFDPEWVNEQINKAKTIPLAFRGWIVDAVPGEDADGKMTGS